MPRTLPPSKPIEHLFFYKNFICLVYSDQTWRLYNTPDGDSGWVGKDGGREKAVSVVDRICKNIEERADREQS
jgi:hypothetical protein